MTTESDDSPAQSAGDLFIARMRETYDFDPHEHALLLAAASTLDEIDSMEQALVASGPVIKGSTGQDRVNPLIPALANHRLTLLRVLRQLNIEGEAPATQTPAQRAASAKARDAANARWGNARGA
ncbi:hypothetical protein ACFY91_07865 [Streptomyces albogriseolus]|uniref:hypothetical protein n=1 Tax=Streptomyces albogriseolus TaxID=1887 RepID=UPI0036E83D17